MGKVISLLNQKGGVGKTTSSMNIAMGLSLLGHKVLVIDADPQCDLSTAFGVFDGEYTVGHFLENEPLPDLEEIKVADNLFIVAGYVDLLELKLTKRTFEIPVNRIKDHFDFIVIDCQPQRIVQSKLTLNECILNVTDYLMLPLDASFNSVKGTIDFVHSVDRIKASYNPDLNILGIFFTIVNERELLYKEFKEYLNDQNMHLLMNTYIRKDVNVKKSQSVGQPLAVFNNKTNSYIDYQNLVNELLKRITQ